MTEERHITNNELPSLAYSRTKHLNDFEVEREEFQVTAHTIRQAEQAFKNLQRMVKGQR